VLRPHSSDGQLRLMSSTYEIQKSVSLIDSPNDVGRHAQESVLFLLGICASFEIRILPEIASCSGPDKHDNSATELAAVRYANKKSREAKEVANK